MPTYARGFGFLAGDKLRSAAENEDTSAVERIAKLACAGAETSITPIEDRPGCRAVVFGGLLVVGNPDDIANEFWRISEAGFARLAFGTVTFLDELPYFAQEVIPRLERIGERCVIDS